VARWTPSRWWNPGKASHRQGMQRRNRRTRRRERPERRSSRGRWEADKGSRAVLQITALIAKPEMKR
jgi:hypothetical protein